MDETFNEVKRAMYEFMQRMRQDRFYPPSPEGLTQGEARTIVALDEMLKHGEEMRPGRVAEFTHSTPSALSQALKSLEEKRLIERQRAGGDFRGVTVALTAAGKEASDEARRTHDEHITEVLTYIGEEDARHLVSALRKMMEYHDLHNPHEAPQHQGDDASCV